MPAEPVAADADAGAAASEPPQLPDLEGPGVLNIEELDLSSLLGTVSAASRHEESVLTAPAAVTIFDAEEIHRSGATTVPDLLRLVPGVQVYQTAPGSFNVSIRGAAGLATNNVVVLLDGIPLNNPFDGSVAWGTLPVELRDIERVEVVRGPVSTIYGANAYTGVINVVTRADDGAYLGSRGAVAGGVDLKGKPLGVVSGHVRQGSAGRLRWQIAADARYDSTSTVGAKATQPPQYKATGLGWLELPLWTDAKLVLELAGGVVSQSGADHLAIEPLPQRTASGVASLRLEMAKLAFLDTVNLWARGMALEDATDHTLYTGFSYGGARGRRFEAGVDLGVKLFKLLDVAVGGGGQVTQVDAPFIHPYENDKARPGYFFYGELGGTFFDHLKATAGIRGDLLDVTATTELAYRASIIWFSSSTAFRLTAASAFRSPTWVELGSRFTDPHTGLVLLEGQPNLKPPRSDSVELGASVQLAQRLSVVPTLYYQRFTNLMIEDYAPVVRKSYVNDTVPKNAIGGELEVRWRGERFTVLGTLGVLGFVGLPPGASTGLPAQSSTVTGGLRFQGHAFEERLNFGVGAEYASPRSYQLRAGVPPVIFDTQVGHGVHLDGVVNLKPSNALPLALFLKVQGYVPNGAQESPYATGAGLQSSAMLGVELVSQ